MPVKPVQTKRGNASNQISTLALVCFLAGSSAGAGLVSSFQAGDSGWHLGTVATAQLDSSPDLEIVVPHRDATGNWFLDAFKFTGQRMAGFPYAGGAEEINVSPTICDLDGDGRDEIIFTCGRRVVALRSNGSVLWSRTVEPATYVPDGGFHTVTNGFYWSGTGEFLERLPSTAEFSSHVSSPIVARLSPNGPVEVVTAWKINPDPTGGAQDYNPFIKQAFGVGDWGLMGETWSGGVVCMDAQTGQQRFVYHLHHLLEAGLAIGQPGADSAPAVYALNDSDSVVAFDKSKPFGLWGKGMLHGQFGKNQRLMSGSYQVPIDLQAVDLDGDGLDEVLVPGTQLSSMWQPNETILDHDGAILWRRWLPHVDIQHQYGWHNSACLIPLNPDQDNHIDVLGFNHSSEITFRYWNGIELVDRPGWPKNFAPLLPTPPVVGDVDGDGEQEIVIGTYNPATKPSTGSLLVFALNGTLKQSISVPGGVKHVPALADVEGRRGLDVVYRSLAGKVYVQNLGSTSTNRLSWATHRGSMRRDGKAAQLFPAGTPMLSRKSTGLNFTSFAWTNTQKADVFKIFRAETPSGPFAQIATLTAQMGSYIDHAVRSGIQYFYEVAAVYGSNVVRSAPFPLLPFLNRNLVANSGFEEDDNSHWDKWFTGNVGMTNMSVSTKEAQSGFRSMRILLQEHGSNSTIAQYNQYGIPDSSIAVKPGAFYSFGGFIKSGGLSRDSEHWLEWSSTRTGNDPNPRPTLPWPFYFTPHLAAGTNSTPWTFLNRIFQLPAGFPNIELRHVYTVTGPARGEVFLDNLFFREMPAPDSTNWTVSLPFGSNWKYRTNAPAANWFEPAFNDSLWLTGKAKFGAGGGPTNIATRLPQLCPAYYFRTCFNLPALDVQELLLSATCTDDSGAALFPIRLYLNGTEVPGPLEIVTSQGNEQRHFDLTLFASLLRPGTNTIAVQVRNFWSSWDDVAFDLRLSAVLCGSEKPRADLQLRSSQPRICMQSPLGSIWRMQVCEGFPRLDWQTVSSFTNLTGGPLCFDDPNPARSPSRFYRMVPF